MIIGSWKQIWVLFVLIMIRARLAVKLLESDCFLMGRKWIPAIHSNGASRYGRKRLSGNFKLGVGFVRERSIMQKGAEASSFACKRQWQCNPCLFTWRFRRGTWVANPVAVRQFISVSCTSDMDNIFGNNTSAIDLYWRKELTRVDKPAARRLIPTLVKENPLGFLPGPTMLRKDSLFGFVCEMKQKYSDKVILVRVGEFYETWGVDAIMLVQWCGLNPMGRRAKAGCPVRNIQQTLDGLVGAGLSVCIFEELDDAGTKATTRRKIKPRALTQVVTPGSQTYLFDMTLCQEEVNFHESRPYMGILGTASGGYSVVEVHVDSRSVRWSERLTEEALRASIAASGPVEPLYIQNVPLPLTFLPDHVVELPDVSITPHAESFPRRIIKEVVNLLQLGDGKAEEFLLLRNENVFRPRPIYLATATQIGLIRPDESIPDLVKSLLPQGEVGRSSRFLRRWLLNPPPYTIADNMAELCSEITQLRIGLPDMRPVPIGKVVALLTAQQCNAPLFRDITACLCSFMEVLNGSSYSRLLPHALAVVSFQCGLSSSQNALRCSAQRIVDSIRAVVVDDQERNISEDRWAAPEQLFHTSVSSDPYDLIPRGFFAKNEESYRATVAKDHPIMMLAYEYVDITAKRFCDAVKNDFGPTSATEITWDTINNAILLRKVPKDSTDRGAFKHPFDRNQKRMANRWTTDKVEEALAEYVEASSNASSCARECLQRLCDTVTKDLATVVQAAHWAILLQAIDGHVRHCTTNGWVLPELQAPENSCEGVSGHSSRMPVMQFHELIPYWLPRHKAVSNSFDMEGIYLLTGKKALTLALINHIACGELSRFFFKSNLTRSSEMLIWMAAPNMGGKSTFLRSVMAAALLANCGLMAPAKKSSVPRYSSFYLRGASSDAPSEGKSSFAVEIDDVRVMLRDCTAAGSGEEETNPLSSLGTSLVMVMTLLFEKDIYDLHFPVYYPWYNSRLVDSSRWMNLEEEQVL